MAAIDKIYGTVAQAIEFRAWLEANNPQLVEHLYPIEMSQPEYIMAISNFPIAADKWLFENCPIDWVVERIREQHDLPADEEY